VLLVAAGRPVPTATLIERVWDQHRQPRPGTRCTRTSAESVGCWTVPPQRSASPSAQLERRPAGYVLDVEPDAVDLHRFRRLVKRARDPRSTEAEKANALWEALSLWRGRRWLAFQAAGRKASWTPVGHRLDAAIGWAQADLRLDHPDAVLATLPDLIAEHPLAEPLARVPDDACVACGRTGGRGARPVYLCQTAADRGTSWAPSQEPSYGPCTR